MTEATAMDWNGTSADGIKGYRCCRRYALQSQQTRHSYQSQTVIQQTRLQLVSLVLSFPVHGMQRQYRKHSVMDMRHAHFRLYTCAGNQVPMGSAAGYKMIGVNANSAQVGWAMELAKFLTNEQSQETRFAERQIGPSNIALASLMRLKQM